jgi:GT2 family glycosyltransferase
MDTEKKKDTQREVSSDPPPWPDVLAVVVNWNGRDDVLESLRSLAKVNYPKDKFRILVVDNGSTDGSQAAIAKTYPGVLFKRNLKNLGYVHAVNQGINYGLETNAEYIWVCNNDVVVHEDSLAHLITIGQKDPKIGVVAPVIYSYKQPQTIDNSGYRINFWTGRLKKLTYEEDIFSDPQSQMSDVDSNLGCSNVIKTSLVKTIGTFKSIYQIYFEETDFNVRARRSGFRVVIVKKAKVWHKTAATMDKYLFRRAYLLLRNLLIFEILNAKLKHLIVFLPYFFLVHFPNFLIHGCIYGAKVKRMDKKSKR